MEQVEDNMKALQVAKNWTAETEAKMEAILGNPVTDLPMNFTSFAPVTQRRSFRVNVQFAKE